MASPESPDRWTALELHRAIAAGEISVSSALESILTRIGEVDGATGAVSEHFAESAMRTAEEADARLAAGNPARPLEGIPFTAKANIATIEGTTHAGSWIIAEHRAPRDATAVARLRRAGAILVGKTHCDEFGMGASCENSAFGPVTNPWDPGRVPGGSSGGAAALAGAVGGSFHLGSDTGGSIRQPAAFCGCTGLKPTYGTVSRSGLVAFGSSLDQIGPMTRDAADAAAVLIAMGGPDPLDATTRAEVFDSEGTPVPRRVGIPREYLTDAIEPETRDVLEATAERMREAGAKITEVRLPATPYANACYQVISTAEASANLSRYDGVHIGHRTVDPADLVELNARSRAEGFGPEVRRRILLGTFVLSAGYQEAYYRRALRVRQKITDDFMRAFEEVEVLLAPTSPFPAFALGERITDPFALYACDVLTVSANLAGVPAISIPGGWSSPASTGSELPIGVQIIGPPGGDAAVLALARQYQEGTEWHRRFPEVGGR